MKFSIRLKIVFLGAVVSGLTMGSALFFGDLIFKNNSRKIVVEDVESWLTTVDNSYRNTDHGQDYRNEFKKFYDYIYDIYSVNPDEPEPHFDSFKDKRIYYKDKYKWMYTIDGLGMYPQSPEEIEFRAAFQEFTYTLRDAKIATGANDVYVAFFDEERNKMIYIGDESSYIPNFTGEYLLPGSFVSNLTLRPEKHGDYYKFDINPGTYTEGITIGTVEDRDAKLAYFFVEYDFTSVDIQAKQFFNTQLIILSITYVLLLITFYVLAHFLITRNVIKLSKTSKKFTEELKNNNELIVEDPNINSKDEIMELSQTYVSLEEEIINYVGLIKQEAQAKERMNAELSVASKIQLEALPNSSYADNNFHLMAFIKTAKEVGGDFYDYFYLNDHQVVVSICDVSGKGIPAALFMMRGKELIKSNIISGSTLKDAIFRANNALIKNNDENLFITAFVAIIDFDKHEMVYVNAGHEKPYLLSNGKIKKLDGISNFVLGGVDDFEYQDEKIKFNSGDRIFLFTDGLNEAINNKKEEFSYARIEKILSENVNSSLEETIDKMNASLDEFVGNEDVFDDVTIVTVEANSNELHLSYKKEEVTIIDEVVDKFENSFSYLSAKVKSEFGIIIDEIVNNIISYSENDSLEFSIDFKLEKDEMIVVFKDNGKKFDPLAKEDKYLEEYHDDLTVGGFGISLVKSLSDSQKYEYKNKQNILTIIKKI